MQLSEILLTPYFELIACFYLQIEDIDSNGRSLTQKSGEKQRGDLKADDEL